MNYDSSLYRRSIYEGFARAMKGCEWVVAHGAEEYPSVIGRDLDILIRNREEMEDTISRFYDAALSAAAWPTRWIIRPAPIWGQRVLAVSEHYRVAELHVLYRLSSGPLTRPVDWAAVSDSLFPTERSVFSFKAQVMPLLAGSPPHTLLTEGELASLPLPLRTMYMYSLTSRRPSLYQRMQAYWGLSDGYRMLVPSSMAYSLLRKMMVRSSATTPLILPEGNISCSVKGQLSEVFPEILCGDCMTVQDIARSRARQRLVYLTRPRKDLPDVTVCAPDEESIMNAFASFNDRRFILYREQSEMLLKFFYS